MSIGLIITVVSAVMGALFFMYKIVRKLDKVVTLQPVMVQGLFACLDGLTQLKANGNVTKTKEKLQEVLIKEGIE